LRTRVGRFWFEGPWDYTPYGLSYVQPWPGVFAVLCRSGKGCRLLFSGAADNLRQALETSPGAPDWAGRCQDGVLCVAVRYDGESADNTQVLLELQALADQD